MNLKHLGLRFKKEFHMSSNYRILKLRSGEDIIAKIVGQDQKVFILERPFMFRTMPIMDPLGRTREITTLRNWVKHTTQLRIKIPKDHIAMFMDPDPDAEHLYEMEMEREDTDSGPKKIGPLESLFEQMTGTDDPDTSPTLEDMINKVANTPAQMDIDEKIKDMLDTMQDHIDDIEDENDDAMQEKDYVMMNMAFPASFLDDLLKRGVLNPQDLLNMKKAIDEENEIDDDDMIIDNGEGLTNEHTPEGDGSTWTDWSWNPSDYIEEPDEDNIEGLDEDTNDEK